MNLKYLQNNAKKKNQKTQLTFAPMISLESGTHMNSCQK